MIFKKSFLLVSLLILVSLLSSCVPFAVESAPVSVIKEYFDALNLKDYETCYSKLHPALREKVRYSEFLENIEKSRIDNGEVLAVKIDKLLSFDNKNKVYSYSVITNTSKKFILYHIQMIKQNNVWYINSVKPVSYKNK